MKATALPKESSLQQNAAKVPSGLAVAIVMAFAGGYGDAASYLVAGCFTGHLTGNLVRSYAL